LIQGLGAARGIWLLEMIETVDYIMLVTFNIDHGIVSELHDWTRNEPS
jgi:hypothetical protein